MSLLYAQQAIADIQERIESLTKEEVVQALEVIRVTMINEGTKDVGPCRWFYAETDD